MYRISGLLFIWPWLALAAIPAVAAEADRAAIGEGCLAKLNWSEQACQCLADKSGELEDVQQAFLAAMLKQDGAALAKLRDQMTIPQMAQVSMFPVNVGQSCQGGQ